jgi:hypothetical protein
MRIVEGVVATGRLAFRRRLIALHAEFESPEIDRINTDPQCVRCILLRLASAAAKATRSTEVRVVVASEAGGAASYLRIDVTGARRGSTGAWRHDPGSALDDIRPAAVARLSDAWADLIAAERVATRLGAEILIRGANGNAPVFTLRHPLAVAVTDSGPTPELRARAA